eukprot:maker-scaffold281_size224178-snap-gene-1.25 protein:Tk10987 transcript:maker-scaffold281_size224178-snap-gene-1.25-mRNA-1 annotation:"fructose- -bisphosphatase tigar"
MKVELYLVRHGQTEGNKERVLQGQKDYPLNELGRTQAGVAGEALKDVPFQAYFSSDLSRARETAEIIQRLNSTPQGSIVAMASLRERGFGIMENQPIDNYSEYCRQKGAKSFDLTPPEGENREDVQLRARQAFLDIAAQMAARENSADEVDILVACHGGLIREMLTVIIEQLGGDISASKNQKYKCIVSNTSITRIAFIVNQAGEPSEVKIVDFNNTNHIETIN